MGNLTHVARRKACFWVSWPPLGVFRLPHGFRPLPSLEMEEAQSCSGPPELRSLSSIGLGRKTDCLRGSLVGRLVVVGSRCDSLELSLPCVLGTCPRLANRVYLLMWGRALLHVPRLCASSMCLVAYRSSRLGGGCDVQLLPALCFLLCCKSELDVRIFGTSGTGLEGRSKGFSIGSYPWLRRPPPWKES